MDKEYSLGKLIEILTHHIEEYERKIIEQTELARLSTRQLFYLDEIYHLENPTLSELAEHFRVSKPSVTMIVEKLVKYGFINRVKSDTDKRSHYVHLTGKGKKLAIIHDRIHDEIAEQIKEHLNATEFEQLILLLNKIVDRI